jgi:hypothetical protein
MLIELNQRGVPVSRDADAVSRMVAMSISPLAARQGKSVRLFEGLALGFSAAPYARRELAVIFPRPAARAAPRKNKCQI